MIKISSLILIGLIIASSLGMANAEFGTLGLPDLQKTETMTPDQKIITTSVSNHQAKKIEVDLSESMGTSTNDNSNNNQPQNEISNSANTRSSINTQINLFENLSIYDNIPGQNAFLVLKQNSDTVTTMERISNSDRIRFNGRSIVINNGIPSKNINMEPITFLKNLELSPSRLLNQNVVNNFGKINENLLNYLSESTHGSSVQGLVYRLSDDLVIVKNFVSATAHDSVNGKNPTIFLLLVPLSGYILVRAEGARLRVSNSRQALSFCFIAILISSAVIEPVSISPSFLVYAYSQNNGSGTDIQPSGNNSGSDLQFNNYSNFKQLQFNNYSNYKQLQFNNHSNSTHLQFNNYSNSTQLQFNNHSNSIQLPTLPSSIQSWNFGAQNNDTTTVGQIGLTNQTNKTVLQLQGNGFLTANGSATKDLKDLTLSAWVKPDYTQGAPVFTVISKENEFTLSINNEIPPYQTAQFSVFDGIKWDTVSSTVPIGQSWNNLAATFNGSSIALYVNGTFQSSMPITGIPTIAVNGNLATKNYTDISSNADVVIGAYYNNIRNEAESQFSGLLSNVNLYDSLLTPTQISEVYGQNISTFYPTLATGISNFTSTNSTSIQNTNSTNPLTSDYPNSTLNNSTIPANSTVFAVGNGTMGGLFLRHNKILINQPVMWVQNVTLTNQTQDLAMEIPADAHIVHLDVIHNNRLQTLFNLNQMPTGFTAVQNQTINGIGISNNTDIQQKHLNGLSLLNQLTSQNLQYPHGLRTLSFGGNLSAPLVSLGQIPKILQTNKPTKLLFINESASKYDIAYVTPAPFTIEKDLSIASKYDKLVWVAHNSTLHYTNVTAFSNIPEDLVKEGAHFKLNWLVNGSSVDVTNDARFAVKLVDTNGDGIPDQIQWTVPHLSQQQFQITAQIEVINVQSYPAVGGNWTVYFNTTGTADLNITSINGTNFGTAPPADLKFLQLNNGTTVLSPTIEGNSIIYHNYSSNETGFEISHVMTFAHHHLMFQFGNSTAYANNNAFIGQIAVDTPLSVFIDSSGNFNIGSALDYASKIPSSGGTPTFNVTSTAAFGVAANSNTGVVYVADTNDNVINEYSSSGSSQGSFGSSTLDSPTGVTVDSSGNIYVADTGDDLVKEFSSSGTLETTFGSGTGTGNGQFTGPMGVAVNSTGWVYVTDTGNNRVEIFNPSGTYSSSFGTAGNGNGQFNSPIGIAIDGFNNPYVADTQNDRIEKFSPSGTFLETFGSTGTAGSEFDGPMGIGIDSNNGIYVADAGNNRVSKFYPDDVGFTENVSLTDNTVSAVAHHTVTLSTESVGTTDTVTAFHHQSVTLSTESVGTTDNQVTTSHSQSVTLSTESVGTTDNQVTTSYSQSVTLSTESVGTTDNTVSAVAQHTTTLSTESVGTTDTVTTSHGQSVTLSTESVGTSDTVVVSQSVTLSTESVGTTDNTVSAVAQHTVPLTESVGTTDTVTAFHPQSVTLSAESVGTTDNQVTTSHGQSVPLTIESVGTTDNPVTVSQIHTVPLTESVGTTDTVTAFHHQSVTLATESMSLSDTFATGLTPTQQLVGNTQTQITVNPSRPQLVVISPTAALSTVTIPANVTTPSINYSSIYTTIDNTNTVQISNPLDITKYSIDTENPIVQVTIPANTAMSGTSWNGVLDLPTVQTGQNLVIPTPSGQTSTVKTVLEMGSSIPMTFNNAVQLVLFGQAGEHIGYYYSPSSVTEITTTCTDDTQATNNNLPAGGDCKINVGSDLHIWTKHFTGFATWSSGSVSPSPSPSVSTGGGGAGAVGVGGVGVGGVGAGVSSSGESSSTFGGVLAPELKIDSVSYNLCQNDTVSMLVEYSVSTPTVILRTSLTGTVQATLAQVQPFAQENQNSTIQKLVYVAQVDPKETSFEVVALQAADNNVFSVGETVNVSGCEGNINYENTGATSAEQIPPGAPEIFNVKSQIGNGIITPSEENQFTNSQPVTVSAIINSPTPLSQVELRFVPIGNSTTGYSVINMGVTPLQISNTTYAVSGIIPESMMQAPAITYWIDAQNNAGKTTDSGQYTIGVKPQYDISGNLEMDISPTRAEGTMGIQTAYFTNNSTGHIYGSVSLIVDGNVTYTSPPQVFGTGQTAVNLEWKAPSTGKLDDYNVQAIANFYDKSFETSASSIIIFPSVQTIALSQLSSIDMLNESNNTIAQPLVLYSSFNNEGTMQYNVIAPDGVCVIGGSSDCLVTNSTLGLAGNFKSVTIGDQIYRVRYSGPDSPLERFSITSVDPILGNWKVGIDSQQGLLPQAHAMDDVYLKIKYRAIDSLPVTLLSQ
ncbi:MAG: LamG-like jellyroll fold domain-containing protein [Nitrosotalea sp.]